MENQFLDNDLINRESKSLSGLINGGYETHSVDYIKKGFHIFKQDMGSFIGFLLIVGVSEAIISAIPILKSLASPLMAPIMAGAYLVSKRIDKNEGYTFSNFLDGTKKYRDLFLVALIPTLVIALVTLILIGMDYFKWAFLSRQSAFPVNNLGIPFSTSLMARGGLAGLLAMVIFILFMFSRQLVLFENFSPIRALEISAKIISKRFFNWLGFLILIGLFNFAGLLCIVIGLLITIPASICALYVAYEDVVGMDLRD